MLSMNEYSTVDSLSETDGLEQQRQDRSPMSKVHSSFRPRGEWQQGGKAPGKDQKSDREDLWASRFLGDSKVASKKVWDSGEDNPAVSWELKRWQSCTRESRVQSLGWKVQNAKEPPTLCWKLRTSPTDFKSCDEMRIPWSDLHYHLIPGTWIWIGALEKANMRRGDAS